MWFEQFLRKATSAADTTDAGEIAKLLEVCGHFGLDETALANDLRAVVLERLAMWLLGEPALCLNYLERREVVERHLLRITKRPKQGSEEFRELVDFVTQAQARVVAAAEAEKDGINSLSEPAISALLQQQGFRCDVCGVPLRGHVARSTSRFPGGQEPVYSMELDHLVPFYFAANDFVRILCKPCNVLKWDRLGVQEDGAVVCANHLRPRDRASVRRRMIFWALAGSRRCSEVSCTETVRSSALLIANGGRSVSLTYGNMTPYCLDHAPQGAHWVHDHFIAGVPDQRPTGSWR